MPRFNRAAVKAETRRELFLEFGVEPRQEPLHSYPAGNPAGFPATVPHLTFEGAKAFPRPPRHELFLLAVSYLAGEDTFYESAAQRERRFVDLVRGLAIEDPSWVAGLLGWLRGSANLRTAPMIGALEAAQAMAQAGLPGGRQVVSSVLQRADEPGEALTYWFARHGRRIPQPVKRGVADAARRLYSEYSLLKYDTDARAIRFGDVVDLLHPRPTSLPQSDLFKVALERRHRRGNLSHEQLPMLRAQAALRQSAVDDPDLLLDPRRLSAAGMTWEDAVSLAGPEVDRARLWEALIPSMGYMALLRNLRNFDQAGVGDAAAERVAARLSDPDQVARSRQLPFRFLSAYRQVKRGRWQVTLDQALQLSLANLPALPGRTLILIDTSGSMSMSGLSARSKMTPAMVAATFGVALGAKGEQVDVHGFATGVFPFQVQQGDSVIESISRFCKRIGKVGHGTDIVRSLAATYADHDRVVLISDMQTVAGPHGNGIDDVLPRDRPLYGFNLCGYQPAAFLSVGPHRHELGGLSDATFRLLPLIEAGAREMWPWLGMAGQ